MGHYLWGLSERRELSGCCAPPCLCIFGPGHSYSRLTFVLGSNFREKNSAPSLRTNPHFLCFLPTGTVSELVKFHLAARELVVLGEGKLSENNMFFPRLMHFSDTPFSLLKNRTAPLHKFPIRHSLQLCRPRGLG